LEGPLAQSAVSNTFIVSAVNWLADGSVAPLAVIFFLILVVVIVWISPWTSWAIMLVIKSILLLDLLNVIVPCFFCEHDKVGNPVIANSCTWELANGHFVLVGVLEDDEEAGVSTAGQRDDWIDQVGGRIS
jgi:hypothetical protein